MAACLGAFGCADRKVQSLGANVSETQLDSYLQTAIGESPEGVVIIPMSKAEKYVDMPRLNEIAQNLRRPLARCFVDRSIRAMKPVEDEGRIDFEGVPDGQIRLRTRIGADGTVVRVDIDSSTFRDEQMVECITARVEAVKFPPSRDGITQWIDVIYWVSLGRFRNTEQDEFQALLRRETAMAAVRGKKCLIGRARPGEYDVVGLSLVDKNGETLANRIDRQGLSDDVGDCLATAFRSIRVPPAPDSFVRPIRPQMHFTVAADGEVTFGDERWLELVLLEERTLREERKAEEDANYDAAFEAGGGAGSYGVGVLAGSDTPSTPIDEGREGPSKAAPPKDSSGVAGAGGSGTPGEGQAGDGPSGDGTAPSTPAQDPSKGGIRLDLGSRPRR